jgi:hypothetical protein
VRGQELPLVKREALGCHPGMLADRRPEVRRAVGSGVRDGPRGRAAHHYG